MATFATRQVGIYRDTRSFRLRAVVIPEKSLVSNCYQGEPTTSYKGGLSSPTQALLTVRLPDIVPADLSGPKILVML